MTVDGVGGCKVFENTKWDKTLEVETTQRAALTSTCAEVAEKNQDIETPILAPSVGHICAQLGRHGEGMEFNCCQRAEIISEARGLPLQ